MEIIQEIGSYAGFAAVLGLAVLSVLYFSQARDVKRLREWAGRAPERSPQPAQTQRVVAQPIARPAQPVAGGTPPPVPRPPGVQPAQASAAGAAPAVASGPAPATPAGTRGAEAEADADDQEPGEAEDVTALDTVVHPPPGDEDEGLDTDDHEALDADEDGAGGDIDDGELAGEEEDFVDEETESDELGDDAEENPDVVDEDTGEWHPEDEHSDIDVTDEHEIPPATPAASGARPPEPPRPFPRRSTPVPAASSGRGDRTAILPPYAEARPSADDDLPDTSAGRGRRPVLIAAAVLVALAVVVLGAVKLTGGSDSGSSGGGLSATATSTGTSDGKQAAIDPSSVTVAVLNGTTVPGLAATLGDKVSGEGFKLGTVTNNIDQERAESVVLFAPGAEREAKDVARRLGISQREPVDPDSQSLAGDATVVVVAGADQNQ